MPQAPRTYIALVTPYGFTRGQRLADELDAMGYETTIVDQPTHAGHALDADACVIVLTPDGWRDPAIVEVMRGRPATLIPVLAAPMDPPRAQWSSEPIPMRGSAREIAEAIADAVDDAVGGAGASGSWSRSGSGGADRRSTSYGRDSSQPSRPRGATSSGRAMSRPYPRVAGAPMGGPGLNAFGQPLQTANRQPQKKKASPGRTIGILGVILVVLGGVGFAGYHYRNKLFPQQAAVSTQMGPYTAAVPGSDCDKGKGQWQLPQDHSYFTTACQADGLLVTQASKLSTLSSAIDFTGTGPTFPLSYHIAITANITGGDQHTLIGLIVHGQSPLGGHVFVASADTSWGFQVMGKDGTLAPPERRGFLPQATKTFTLAVDVSGSVMTFTINGTQVTHLYESTYTTTTGVGLLLGTDNPAAKTALVAKFSNFQFTPMPAPTITDADALDTAVAVNAALPTTYTASIPGPSCDKGVAQWASPAYFDQTGGAATCQSAALQIKANANTGVDVGYYGLKGVFKSSNYTVAVTVTTAAGDGNSCGGVLTRDSVTGGYLYVVCGDSSYAVFEYAASTKKLTVLDGGNPGSITGGGPYSLSIVENGSTHVLKINGKTVSTTTNKDQVNTDHLALFSLASAAGPSTVTFNAFSFTNG